MESSTVVVTGGAGFIGSHIVDALVSAGHEVRVIDDLRTGHRDNIAHHGDNITFVEGSITDMETLQDVCAGADAIVHQAAIASVPESIEHPVVSHAVNVTGTLNVFEVARMLGIDRVVYASSAAVYGDDPSLPKHEAMSHKPQSPYALHKCMNEYYAALYYERYGLTTVGLRYFNVFGPRQDPSSPYSGVISIFADRIPRDEPITIFGDGTTTRDFVYVADVVAANLLALASATHSASVYNIGTGTATSLNELAEVIGELSKRTPDITHADPRSGDIKHSVSDITKAKTELGYAPSVTFQEGIEELLISLRA